MAITIERLMQENKELKADRLNLARENEKLNDKIAAMQILIENRDELIIKYKRSFEVGDDR